MRVCAMLQVAIVLGGPFLPRGFDAAVYEGGHLLRSRAHSARQLPGGGTVDIALVVAGCARRAQPEQPRLNPGASGRSSRAELLAAPFYAPLPPRCSSQGAVLRNALVASGRQQQPPTRVVMDDKNADVVDMAFGARQLLLAELARWRRSVRGGEGGGSEEEEEERDGEGERVPRCEVSVITSAFALPRARIACMSALSDVAQSVGVEVALSFTAAPDTPGVPLEEGESGQQRGALACLAHIEQRLLERWLPARLALERGESSVALRQQVANAEIESEADWCSFLSSGALPGGVKEGAKDCGCDETMLCMHHKRPRAANGAVGRNGGRIPVVVQPEATDPHGGKADRVGSSKGGRKSCGCDESMLCLHRGPPAKKEDAFVPAPRVRRVAELLPCGCDPLTMLCMHKKLKF